MRSWEETSLGIVLHPIDAHAHRNHRGVEAVVGLDKSREAHILTIAQEVLGRVGMGLHRAVDRTEIVDQQPLGNIPVLVLGRRVAGRSRDNVVAPRAVGRHTVEVVGQTIHHLAVGIQLIGRARSAVALIIDQAEEIPVVLENPVGPLLGLLSFTFDADHALVEAVGRDQIVDLVDRCAHDDRAF